jgi:hypothetical protein
LKRILAAAGIALAAASVIVTGIAEAAVVPSSAVSAIGVTQNTAGEAGYYVNDFGNYHIRDAHARFTVTAAMKILPTAGPTAIVSATGTELCDPNTGDAAQTGLLWTDSGFEVGAQSGTLASLPTPQDPCVQDGVLSPSPDHDLLGAGTGNPVIVGDVITVDTYYNPTPGSHGRHVLQYTACDLTTDVCRQAFDSVHARNFFEAGIGVENAPATSLTAPALNPLVAFTSATFNNYNGSAKNSLASGGWQLKEAETVNGASQVTLLPSAIAGTTFRIAEGSASS